jgi:hypothetical protein
VFLGALDGTSEEYNLQFLSQWEMAIVDPLQCGILSTPNLLSTKLLGRIDLRKLLPAESPVTDVTISLLDWLPQLSTSRLYGILLAGWEDLFAKEALICISTAIIKCGLQVYLEVSPPDFLEDTEILNTDTISGLIIRNGTIFENGDRRDVFAMEKLKSAIKGFVLQSCLRDFVTLMWETLENDAVPSNATIIRSNQWCKFNNVLLWIGSSSSMCSPILGTSIQKPLSAFEWLKEPKVMQMHEKWRNGKEVKRYTSDSYTFF